MEDYQPSFFDEADKQESEEILETTGLLAVHNILTGDLSGGQLRRFGLALELV
jgi:ABC-type Mn2+/Zn2+ transport system ATPase subunit